MNHKAFNHWNVPTAIAGAALLISLFPLCAYAQRTSEPIQAVPLVGQDITQKLPAPLQNLIQSGIDLNKSISSWSPPVLSGRGEQISQAAQSILRAAVSFVITAIAWLIVLATQAVSIIAGIVIGIVNWFLAFGHTL